MIRIAISQIVSVRKYRKERQKGGGDKKGSQDHCKDRFDLEKSRKREKGQGKGIKQLRKQTKKR